MMKLLVLASLFLFVCNATSVHWMDIAQQFENKTFAYFRTFLMEVTQEYEKFKQDYNRIYKTAEEEKLKLLTFMDNFVFVKQVNYLYDQGKYSYNVKINHFSDMNKGELEALRCFKPSKKWNPSSTMNITTFSDSSDISSLPKVVDWRKHNYVTPVKDQGQCGSCYAFSTTGSLEGQHFRKTGLLVSLSEQQIVDCSRLYGDMGCDGGEMSFAFDYIHKNGGIDTEKSYPYVSGKIGREQFSCKFSRLNVSSKVLGYVNITPSGDERMLQRAVATIGPISVSIDVSARSFYQYAGGVFYEPSCRNNVDNLDHAVLVVGYGVENGIPYWLVKNSWGVKWGEEGYIKMRRNAFNMCGIATAAIYPLI